MRDSFRRDLEYIVDRILEEEDFSDDEELERSLACFAVGMENLTAGKGARGSKETLLSFGYVAAAICLWKLEQWTPYSGAANFGGFRAVR